MPGRPLALSLAPARPSVSLAGAAAAVARARLGVDDDVILLDQLGAEQRRQGQLHRGGVAPRVGDQPRGLHRGAVQLRQAVHRRLLELNRRVLVVVPAAASGLYVAEGEGGGRGGAMSSRCGGPRALPPPLKRPSPAVACAVCAGPHAPHRTTRQYTRLLYTPVQYAPLGVLLGVLQPKVGAQVHDLQVLRQPLDDDLPPGFWGFGGFWRGGAFERGSKGFCVRFLVDGLREGGR